MLQAEALLAGLEARDDSTSIVMLHAGCLVIGESDLSRTVV